MLWRLVYLLPAHHGAGRGPRSRQPLLPSLAGVGSKGVGGAGAAWAPAPRSIRDPHSSPGPLTGNASHFTLASTMLSPTPAPQREPRPRGEFSEAPSAASAALSPVSPSQTCVRPHTLQTRPSNPRPALPEEARPAPCPPVVLVMAGAGPGSGRPRRGLPGAAGSGALSPPLTAGVITAPRAQGRGRIEQSRAPRAPSPCSQHVQALPVGGRLARLTSSSSGDRPGRRPGSRD